MADVFLSYSREDQALAGRLVELLEDRGWDVFWDQETRAGTLWPKVLEDELNRARCLIVLWTAHSVASRWVRIEANEALQCDKLLPVRIENVKPPMEFRQTQTLDLVGWTGDPSDSRLPRLFEDLGVLARCTPRRREREAAAAVAAPAAESASLEVRKPPAVAVAAGGFDAATADVLADAEMVHVADAPSARHAATPDRLGSPTTPQDDQRPQDLAEADQRPVPAPPSTVARGDASRLADAARARPFRQALPIRAGVAAGLAAVLIAAVWWMRPARVPDREPSVAPRPPEVVTAPVQKATITEAGISPTPQVTPGAERITEGPRTGPVAADPPPRIAARPAHTIPARCIAIADKFQTTGQLTDEERRFLSSAECAK